MLTTIYQNYCERGIEWLDAVERIHNRFYDYSSVNYVNARKKVTIKCPIHGRFEQTPHDHKNKKRGCSKCFGNAKLTNKEVDNRLIAANRQIRRIGDIENAMTNLEWLCLNDKCGGTWKATPGNVLNKNTGCPYCKIGYISNHQGILYFLRIVDKDTDFEFLKIGITKKNVQERYSGKRFDVLEEIFIKELPLKEAYNIEQRIINSMKEYSYLAPKTFGGRTECFIDLPLVRENIINLSK